MSIKRFLCSFFLILLSASSYAENRVQYENMKVCEIDVAVENLAPTHSFNPASVKARLQTKAGNFFSQNEFDNDLKKLSEEYDRIEPKFEIKDGELSISLKIWLKSKIRNITICGNEKFTTKKLNGELEIKPGDIFEREKFIADFNKLKLFYVKKGYFETDFSFEIEEIPATNEVDIQIIIQEGRSGRIKTIEFRGFTKKEESALLEMMVTSKYNFLLSWYTGGGNYHPDMIEHDKMTILNYLQDEGYADSIVNIELEEAPSGNKVVLIISADKGHCYTFGNITLCGNTLFSNEVIWDEFEFGKGSLYSPEALRDTINGIRDLYGVNGYIEATVDVQLSLRDDAPIYDLAVTINEGEQYFVGMIRVFGNTCTNTKIILHECLLCPGDVFDIRKIEGTETRLKNTGYFSNVNVYQVRSQDENLCFRDVYVEVEECDTGSVGIFFGFSSLESLFGGVELTERNFNILGIPKAISQGGGSLRGNGEYLHLKTNIGYRETSYLMQWTKPYFMDTPWIVGFDIEKTNNRALSRQYELKTYGGNVHATLIMNDFLKYSVHYRALHTKVDVRGDQNAELVRQARFTGLISAVGAAAIYDSTDSPRRPTSGFRSRLSYEIAGVGGDFDFMKIFYLNAYYYPVCPRGVLKFRADFQFIKTYGNTHPRSVPLSERLYLGGEGTVRGYRPYIIGPKFGNNEPEGGMSAYLLSEEYQHNLLKNPCIDAFVFVDAGYVSMSEFTLGRQAASVGFGLRVEVMRNMPIIIGLGFPIHPTETRIINGQSVEFDNTQRFFFSMGGCF